jgi:hypothetical protein
MFKDKIISVSKGGNCVLEESEHGFTLYYENKSSETYLNEQFFPEYWNEFCAHRNDSAHWCLSEFTHNLEGKWTTECKFNQNQIVLGFVCNEWVRCQVLGYVEHCDYIGAMVSVIQKGTKFEKQNKGLPVTLLFGREMKET